MQKASNLRPLSRGIVNLAVLQADELRWLLDKRVLGLPALLRNLRILTHTGLQEILVLHSPAQTPEVESMKRHRLLKDGFVFIETRDETFVDDVTLENLSESGAFLLNPRYLVNALFIKTFKEALGAFAARDGGQTQVAGENFRWLPGDAFRHNGKPTQFSALLETPSKMIALENVEATGVLLETVSDIKRAEKIVFADAVRKKGGLIAKVLNEPISLRMAKWLAWTPVTPNQITLVNTILGLLSAWLIYHSAVIDAYWPLAAGAILFYLVDIFDGIDGELARFTYRFSTRGALYDTISDNMTLLAFIIACGYKSYTQTGSLFVVFLAGLSIALFIVALVYLYFFCMHHFKNASLRQYEARFMPLVPRENDFIRFIFFIRHCYTKDIFCAFFSLLLLLNQPIFVFLSIILFTTMLLVGFVYMGRNYGHLIAEHNI